jgi:hypothetical protein
MKRGKIHENQDSLPLRSGDETPQQTAARMVLVTEMRDGQSSDPLVRGRRAAEDVLRFVGSSDPELPSGDARELFRQFEPAQAKSPQAEKPTLNRTRSTYVKEQDEIRRNPWTK